MFVLLLQLSLQIDTFHENVICSIVACIYHTSKDHIRELKQTLFVITFC